MNEPTYYIIRIQIIQNYIQQRKSIYLYFVKSIIKEMVLHIVTEHETFFDCFSYFFFSSLHPSFIRLSSSADIIEWNLSFFDWVTMKLLHGLKSEYISYSYMSTYVTNNVNICGHDNVIEQDSANYRKHTLVGLHVCDSFINWKCCHYLLDFFLLFLRLILIYCWYLSLNHHIKLSFPSKVQLGYI